MTRLHSDGSLRNWSATSLSCPDASDYPVPYAPGAPSTSAIESCESVRLFGTRGCKPGLFPANSSCGVRILEDGVEEVRTACVAWFEMAILLKLLVLLSSLSYKLNYLSFKCLKDFEYSF